MAIYVQHDNNKDNPCGYIVWADDLMEFEAFQAAYERFQYAIGDVLIELEIKLEE
jgi:hypothetical protein